MSGKSSVHQALLGRGDIADRIYQTTKQARDRAKSQDRREESRVKATTSGIKDFDIGAKPFTIPLMVSFRFHVPSTCPKFFADIGGHGFSADVTKTARLHAARNRLGCSFGSDSHPCFVPSNVTYDDLRRRILDIIPKG